MTTRKPSPEKLNRERRIKAKRLRKIAKRQQKHTGLKMATNHANPPFELGKYSQEVDDLSNRLEELEKLRQQADQFDSLAVSLRLERQAFTAEILDSGDPSGLGEKLDKLDRMAKLNDASSQALGERLESRERYLHERVPLAIKAFGTLREYVVGAVLETCRGQVRALIAPGYHVEDSVVDSLVICMAPYADLSKIKLPSVGWVASQPLDQAPIYWSSLTRPYTAAELAELRVQKVRAILEGAKSLCEAARGLVVACGPYAQDCPPFKCEPEVEPAPRQADPKVLAWNEPLGSDEAWLKGICKAAGRAYPPTNPQDIEILNRMLDNRHANPVSHGSLEGAQMIGDTSLTP